MQTFSGNLLVGLKVEDKESEGGFKEIKEFTVRQIIGFDEENMSHKRLGSNGGKIVTALLYGGPRPNEKGTLLKLGNYEQPKITEHLINSLSIADRDYLSLEIRKLSYGNMLESTTTCPQCETKYDISIDLNDIEIKEWNSENKSFTLPEDFEYKEDNFGKDVELRLQNGFDQIEISKSLDGSFGALSSMIIAQSIVTIGDKKFPKDGARFMTSRNREALLSHILSVKPGPVFETDYDCLECEFDNKIKIGLDSFFTMGSSITKGLY